MNLKITPLKTIISIILGIIGGFLYWNATFLIGIVNSYSPWIISGIIITIIIYTLWSLIQEKK